MKVPTIPAELDLWEVKESFLFSVFTMDLVEPTAAEIIRRYSEPGTSEFGLSHMIYPDLKNAMEKGVSGKLRLETLEADISKTFLDKHWTKGVAAYMTRIGHLLSHHFQLRDASVYANSWYLSKLNASFKYHTEMRQHISTLEAQQDEMHRILTESVAGYTAPTSISYQEHYDKLLAHGHVVDHAANESKSRRVNFLDSSGRPHGRGHGGYNSGYGGREGNGGRGGCGRGRGTHADYVPPDVYAPMSTEERRKLHDRRTANQGTTQNREANLSRHTGQENQGPPDTIQIDGPSDATRTTNNQAGNHLRNLLANASARSAASRANPDTFSYGGESFVISRQANPTYRIANGCYPDLRVSC
jgi:hypothetical protein